MNHFDRLAHLLNVAAQAIGLVACVWLVVTSPFQ